MAGLEVGITNYLIKYPYIARAAGEIDAAHTSNYDLYLKRLGLPSLVLSLIKTDIQIHITCSPTEYHNTTSLSPQPHADQNFPMQLNF